MKKVEPKVETIDETKAQLKTNTKTKTKNRISENSVLADRLNNFPSVDENYQIIVDGQNGDSDSDDQQSGRQSDTESSIKDSSKLSNELPELNEKELVPQDNEFPAPIDSLEASVGYSSLVRQFHRVFRQRVAFLCSPTGGALSVEAAREKAFRQGINDEEAEEIINNVLRRPSDRIEFVDLHSLYGYSPEIAEQLWERIKDEGRAEFESGHLAANAMLPNDQMRTAWEVARYLGIRESFIDEWKPKGGIELALIDMLVQTFYQWQYWMEQTIICSQTKEREEHPEYTRWKKGRRDLIKVKTWDDENEWLRPYVSEQQAIDHSVQMADRFNRMFLRNLRQLRDLRRYSPVTINNPSQVNIAADGGQQMNLANGDDDKTKKIRS